MRKPYLRLAQTLGIKYIELEIMCSVEDAINNNNLRSSSQVSVETIHNLASRFEHPKTQFNFTTSSFHSNIEYKQSIVTQALLLINSAGIVHS